MTIEDDIAFFQRVPTLGYLEREPLRILAIGAESRYIHTGSVLFQAGESADCGFVVQEGAFELTSDDPRKLRDRPLRIGPGTLLGELALFIDTTRPVTATALEPSTVLRLPRSLFLKTLDTFPNAARRLRDVLGSRTNQSALDMASVRTTLDAPDQKDVPDRK